MQKYFAWKKKIQHLSKMLSTRLLIKNNLNNNNNTDYD